MLTLSLLNKPSFSLGLFGVLKLVMCTLALQFSLLNTAWQNKGTSSGSQYLGFHLSCSGWLGWMVGPPWAKKFWSRANQLLRGAPIRCQNRPKQAKWGSEKSPQTLPFSHFPVMVGHLGPKYLGKTPNVRVTSTQSKKSARAYPWYPVELTFLLVVQFEKFQVLFVYLIHILVFSDHFDLLGIPGYARAYPPPNGPGFFTLGFGLFFSDFSKV